MNYFDFGLFRPRKSKASAIYNAGAQQQGPVDRQALARNVSDMLLRRGGAEPAPGLMGSVQGMAANALGTQPPAVQPQGGMYGGLQELAQQIPGQRPAQQQPMGGPRFLRAINPFRRR